MLHLNHANLQVAAVPELRRFFETAFDFRVIHERGAGNFVLLRGMDGFILALMHYPAAGPTPYPPQFHIGFQVESLDEVHRLHGRIREAGFHAPEPALLQQGRKAYGFYSNAPGGVMVEVSTSAV